MKTTNQNAETCRRIHTASVTLMGAMSDLNRMRQLMKLKSNANWIASELRFAVNSVLKCEDYLGDSNGTVAFCLGAAYLELCKASPKYCLRSFELYAWQSHHLSSYRLLSQQVRTLLEEVFRGEEDREMMPDIFRYFLAIRESDLPGLIGGFLKSDGLTEWLETPALSTRRIAAIGLERAQAMLLVEGLAPTIAMLTGTNTDADDIWLTLEQIAFLAKLTVAQLHRKDNRNGRPEPKKEKRAHVYPFKGVIVWLRTSFPEQANHFPATAEEALGRLKAMPKVGD